MDAKFEKKPGPTNDIYGLDENKIKPRPGYSAVDEARTIVRPSISRSYEFVMDVEQVHRKRAPGIILCPGAGCGMNRDGHVAHFWPGQDLNFLGFLVASGDDRETAVKIRGSVILTLPGAKPGDPVFCSGPNSFSLVETPGSACIGAVRYIQGNRCAVAFKRAGDSRPLNLDVSTV